MDWIAQVVEQGRLTIASAQVWVIILWAIVATGAFTAFGTWVTRRIGLLSPGAPPTRDANPSTAEIVAFMRDHGIEYILADPQRLNTLVPDAPSVIRLDGYELFRLAEQAGAWDGYAARR